MNDVVDRLQALSTASEAGDWLDVAARAERLRRIARRRRMLLAAVAAALLVVPALAVADRITEFLVVSAGKEEVPIPMSSSGVSGYITGQRLYDFARREEQRLERPLITGNGVDWRASMAAIETPDGGAVLYRASEPEPEFTPTGDALVPLLVRHDLETGEGDVVARGVDSFAIGASGALAYNQRLRPGRILDPTNSDIRLVGHLFVRPSLEGTPKRWSASPSIYTVHAWAGKRLIVSATVVGDKDLRRHFGNANQPDGGVYAISGPGRMLLLPIRTVLAVDPTGELVAGLAGNFEIAAFDLSKLRIVRVADGKVMAELELATELNPDAPYNAGSFVDRASWVGHEVAIGFASDETGRVIAIVRFDGRRLAVVQILTVEARTAQAAGLELPPAGTLSQPLFVDDDGRELLVHASVAVPRSRARGASDPSFAILVCDREESRCRRGKSWIQAGLDEAPAFVYNPSRPLREP